jgi:bacteriocin-like protein
MKTLFAYNENFEVSVFEVLTSEELEKVKGGHGPGDFDLYWDDDLN